MAVLSNTDRADVTAEFQRDECSTRDPLPGFTKAQLRTAVDVIDDWLDTNLSALNLLLPLAVRNGLTLKQKYRLFLRVLRRRMEIL
jgi:hypothetical protein